MPSALCGKQHVEKRGVWGGLSCRAVGKHSGLFQASATERQPSPSPASPAGRAAEWHARARLEDGLCLALGAVDLVLA